MSKTFLALPLALAFVTLAFAAFPSSAGPGTLSDCAGPTDVIGARPPPPNPSSPTPEPTMDTVKRKVHETVPTVCVAVFGAKQVAVSNTDHCVLLTGGLVHCEGAQSKALGNGDRTTGDVMSISLGWDTRCFLLVSGNVECDWSANPHQFTGGRAVAVSADPSIADRACALLSTGNVTCWGGDGAGYDGGDAVSIDAGYGRACAVLVSHNVACWGQDGYGNTAYYGYGDAMAVSAVGSDTCVLRFSGSVHCYGGGWPTEFNYDGSGVVALQGRCMLFSSGNIDCMEHPFSAESRFTYNGGDALGFAVGYNDACILLASGSVTCPGLQYYGQFRSYTPLTPPV